MIVIKCVPLLLLSIFVLLPSVAQVNKAQNLVRTFAWNPPFFQSIHLDNRIINGQNTAVHYPHHVYISYQNAQGGGFFGAGSIITPTHVLTVAQIVRNFVSWNVGFGSNHFSQLSWIRTDTARMHPNYNVDSRENDIALVIVPTPFVWSAAVQPAILSPTSQQLPLPNEQGIILGFGWTASGNVQASQLQVAFVRVIPDDQCQNVIAVSFPNHFCAFDAIIPANICQGDLGGGFLTTYRNREILVGLNSILLEGCNTVWPSAYTRIYPYLSWIQSEAGI